MDKPTIEEVFKNIPFDLYVYRMSFSWWNLFLNFSKIVGFLAPRQNFNVWQSIETKLLNLINFLDMSTIEEVFKNIPFDLYVYRLSFSWWNLFLNFSKIIGFLAPRQNVNVWQSIKTKLLNLINFLDKSTIEEVLRNIFFIYMFLEWFLVDEISV